ncbi:MAG TPA: hypothetical protein VF230_11365 [Acidimicrobiales bacterium]
MGAAAVQLAAMEPSGLSTAIAAPAVAVASAVVAFALWQVLVRVEGRGRARPPLFFLVAGPVAILAGAFLALIVSYTIAGSGWAYALSAVVIAGTAAAWFGTGMQFRSQPFGPGASGRHEEEGAGG